MIDRLEEGLISLLLGLMTALTFANVVARYVFNSNILWALELTVFMFGWLVLLGASYAVKKGMHLGVDAIVQIPAPGPRKVMALISVALHRVQLSVAEGGLGLLGNFCEPAQDGRSLVPARL